MVQFAWVYEGEVMNASGQVMTGIADMTIQILGDGTFRGWYGYPPLGPSSRSYIASATSQDGLKWVEDTDVGFSGGWPNVIKLPDGRFRMYYGAGGIIAAAVSSDGKKWESEKMTGFERAPSPETDYLGLGVIPRQEGGYRMYYTRKSPSPKYPMTGETRIFSAISEDGLNWQLEPGVRMETAEDRGLNDDPEVIVLQDGTLKMFWFGPPGRIFSATSKDGLRWEQVKGEDIVGNDPELIVLPDGSIRVYANWKFNNPSAGKDQQRMWAYRWQQVTFALEAAIPDWDVINQATKKYTVKVTGNPGERVSLTGSLLSGLAANESDGGTVTADPPSGTVPFESTLTIAPNATMRGHGLLIIKARNGKMETHKLFGLRFQPPS